ATANGSGALTNVTQVSPTDTGFTFSGIALDAADGYYFVTNGSGNTPQILRGSISGGALTQIYAPTNSGNGPPFTSNGVFNPVNQRLYVAQSDNAAPFGSDTDSGIYSMTVNGTSITRVVGPTASGLNNPQDIAIDATNNLIFFTDFGDSQDTAGSRTNNP